MRYPKKDVSVNVWNRPNPTNSATRFTCICRERSAMRWIATVLRPRCGSQPQDFEIYRSEMITSTATAMLVDLSWSMALRGSFQAAKKVALALHNLITSQYPKDSFYIIGFAAYAKELKPHDLPYLQWDEYVLGTNMQHALLLAEKLLAKHTGGTKQIIMISDGEPTAHLENGQAQLRLPPDARNHSSDLPRRQTLHDTRDRHQHLHARRVLLPEVVHGRDRPDQRRPGVLHDA